MPSKQSEDIQELKMPLWKANSWFVVLYLLFFLDLADRYAVAACLPMIKTTLNLTDAQSGMLGTAFSLSIALFVIPTGMLAHKWSRRKVCSIMVILWSFATWGTGLAKGFIPLLIARFGVGLGEAGYAPVSYTLISTWYPKKMRATMMGWYYSASQAGATLGLMLAGWLAYTYGWKACFGILTVPGLILGVVAWYLPDYKNKVDTPQSVDREGDTCVLNVGIKDALAYTFKSPAILLSIIYSGLIALSGTTFTIWGVTLFVRSFDMNVKEAAMFIGFIGIIAIAGPILFGWAADYLQKKNKKGRVLALLILSVVFFLSMLVLTQYALAVKGLVAAFFAYGICKATLASLMATANTLTQDLLPPYYRSLSSSFIPIANQGIGGALGPILCGVFSDYYGISMALTYVSTISFVSLLICGLFLWKTFDKEQAKVESFGTFNLERG